MSRVQPQSWCVERVDPRAKPARQVGLFAPQGRDTRDPSDRDVKSPVAPAVVGRQGGSADRISVIDAPGERKFGRQPPRRQNRHATKHKTHIHTMHIKCFFAESRSGSSSTRQTPRPSRVCTATTRRDGLASVSRWWSARLNSRAASCSRFESAAESHSRNRPRHRQRQSPCRPAAVVPQPITLALSVNTTFSPVPIGAPGYCPSLTYSYAKAPRIADRER